MIREKGRLQPGKMFVVDMEQGRIIDDDEIKATHAAARPYAEWLERTQYKLEELDLPGTWVPAGPADGADLLLAQEARP